MKSQKMKAKRVRGTKQSNTTVRSGYGDQTGLIRAYAGERKEPVNRMMPLFANKVRKFLTYYESVNMTAASAATASYVYSANGLYDPNITGTGHQPAGFDQMMLFYEHYTVVKAKIIVQMINLQATECCTAVVSQKGTNTPVTVFYQVVEEGYMQKVDLAYYLIPGYMKQLESTCEIGKFEGTPQPLDSHDMRGASNANPSEQVYWHLQAQNIDAATVNVQLNVLIEFDAVFTEPRPAPYSFEQLKAERARAGCVKVWPKDVGPGPITR
jgi:hypothetical protein